MREAERKSEPPTRGRNKGEEERDGARGEGGEGRGGDVLTHGAYIRAKVGGWAEKGGSP